MAEDTNTVPTETTELAAPVKKTRAPRQKKEVVAKDVVAGVAAAPVETAKPTGRRGKRATTASTKPAAAPKATRAKRTAKVDATPAAVDGFDDLIKLEQENQSLRKQLAGKLRAENADLRKKLGQA